MKHHSLLVNLHFRGECRRVAEILYVSFSPEELITFDTCLVYAALNIPGKQRPWA